MPKQSSHNSERQRVFGLVTDRMSDSVYEALYTKAKSKQLGSYIIKLVQNDLQKNSPQNEQLEQMMNLQRQMMQEIFELRRQIVNMQVVAVPVSKEEEQEEEIREGRIVVNDIITGSLDNEDLDDVDF